MNIFPYGTVFRVERNQSLSDIYTSLSQIKDNGFNFVVIWPAVFWWEDRSHNDYPFHTGHKILSYAEEIGLNIIVELAGQITSLEYAPDFLMKEEYYALDRNGYYKKDKYSYDYINFNHPEIKQLIRRFFIKAAQNYKGYKSLYGYDIWNETMFSSIDKYTLQFFRKWLEKKYKSIEKLNDTWDRIYYDWSQIDFTNWMWASVMPVVDYQQFKKDNVGILLNEWRNYIREVDKEHPVIADNIFSMITMDDFYDRPQDDWNVSKNVDEFGISFYPKNKTPAMEEYRRWETFAGIHSASEKGRFWISEMQTHHQCLFNPFSSVKPYELNFWNWEAIAHGAKGLIYWKWHPFVKGIQTYGRGLVDYKGKLSERGYIATSIGRILSENSQEFCLYKPIKPKAAILYDRLNHDFVKAYTINYEPFISSSIYTDSIAGLYKCLWESNIPVEFVTLDDIKNNKINKYKILFITNQLNISQTTAKDLRSYIKDGGIIVCDGKFGEINDEGVLNDKIPGGDLNDILACNLLDINEEVTTITLNTENKCCEIDAYYEKRILEVEDGVEVIGRFKDNAPAIIKGFYGEGEIINIATYLWYGYYRINAKGVEDFLKWLDKTYNISVYDINNNSLKYCSLHGEDGLILFAFNYADTKHGSTIKIDNVSAKKCVIRELYSGSKTIKNPIDGKLILNIEIDAKSVGVYKIVYN